MLMSVDFTQTAIGNHQLFLGGSSVLRCVPSVPVLAVVWMPDWKSAGLEAGRPVQGSWSCLGKKMMEAGTREVVHGETQSTCI